MSAEVLEERLTARDLSLARVQADAQRKAIKDLRELEKEVLAIIREIEVGDAARRGDNLNRVTRVVREMREVSRRVYRGADRRTLRLQAELIEDESKALKTIAGRAGLPLARTLTPKQAQDIADKLLLDGSAQSTQWARQEQGLRDEVEKTLRRVVVADGTTTEAVRAIRGDRTLRYGNGVFRPFERYARATVATAVAGASNAARFETYRINSDVVAMVQAINPLDSRTSPICQARAGRVWSLSTGKGVGATDESFPGPPPWHFNALPAGTAILTDQGYRPIEDIKAGDLVLTHRGRFRPVYATMAKRPNSRIVRCFHTDTGRILRATDEHPILTLGRGWQRADNIQAGDQVFEYPEQAVQPRGGIAGLAEPDNYPSAFDEESSLFDVAGTVAGTFVRPSVSLQDDASAWPHEVDDVARQGVLEDEIRAGAGSQGIEDGLLASIGVLSEMCSAGDEHLRQRLGVVHGVGCFHPPAGCSVDLAILLCLSMRPVVGAALARTLGLWTVLEHLNSLHPRPNLNPMLLTPPVETGSRDAQIPLDGPDRAPIREVFTGDQISDGASVGKVHVAAPCHWHVATIEVARTHPVNGMVYNLAVEDDETYVAEGVIVHNCRTTLIPIDRESSPVAGRTFSQLLDSIPESEQRELLGPGKFDLWRRGKIKVQDLTDQSDRPITVAQLRARFDGDE